MRRIQFSPAAEADLDAIWAYTLGQWGEAQAIRYFRDMQATCAGLASGTLSGRSVDDVRPGYFKAAFGAHLLFYRLTEEALVVIRVLHQRMDVARHL
ncbi:type II toxin-antitoxin system RelE/ParE family toxin [Polymorphum gilvum]|uniref:Toxin n=1 Tax=Polymorphum gilvum (strain LMG 25793 / CGMCC 1.9160 / SL003B-26A1) TaxID=991905 RepID=F2J2A4_POLGS|nr:type II toxin-antitoxin system RelE/ParE family toxin [Polymorphum gilvum]ADZ69800.1 DNA topoisomerase (ATP-hydrolyzing) ParE [Polymorphum gilvum SL003B-26A1]